MQARRVSWASHGLNAESSLQPAELFVHLREDVLEHVLGVVGRQPKAPGRRSRRRSARTARRARSRPRRRPSRQRATSCASVNSLARFSAGPMRLCDRKAAGRNPSRFEPRMRLVRLTVDRLLAHLAEPRRRPVRLSRRGRRRPAAARLRAGSPVAAPCRRAVAAHRRDRAQPPALRPLRRPLGLVVGAARRAGRGLTGPELWLPHGGRHELDRLAPAHLFAQAFTLREYEEDEPFTVAGFSLRARRVPHYDYTAFALRVRARRAPCSRTRATRRPRMPSSTSRATPTSFSARRRSPSRSRRARSAI